VDLVGSEMCIRDRFYDLCRASKEVVIRSKIELNNKRRNVEKVKSMQELALAWDNYRWGEEDMFGLEMTQELFCARLAGTNNLDFLKWAREVKQCAWDEGTIGCGAIQGNVEVVKYCVENGCPMDAIACSDAASNGHLDVLKYLHEHDCPWNSNTCRWARDEDHIECLNYAIKHECPGWERFDPEHPDYDPPVYSDEESESEEEVGEHD
ncbi:ankyrin repeat domain-containing protein, partial [Pseudomonas aeruginosa]|uniref:ankyrin repeat domain-containing protein n=1 Tax=Pseudomonas aeruginosa TaxID=287 RepID=UPI0019694D35